MTRIGLACLILLLTAAPVLARDFRFTPSISVSEEYTDNVENERGGHTDFTTTVSPSFSSSYESGRLTGSLDYTANIRHYANGNMGDDTGHSLDGDVLFEALEDVFFIDVNDAWHQVYTNSRRGTSGTDVREGDSSSQLSQQNIFTFSPYLITPLGPRTSATTRYTFTNTSYQDTDEGQSSNSHMGAVTLDHQLTSTWSANAGGDYTLKNPGKDDELNRWHYSVGSRYEYSENSYVYGNVGQAFSDYADTGSSSTVTWDAGIVHEIETMTVSFTTGVTFEEDPDTGEDLETRNYLLSVTKAYERTTVTGSVGYYEYENAADEDQGDNADSNSGDESQRWTPSLNISHQLSPRLGLDFQASADLMSGADGGRNYYATTTLSYQFSERFSGNVYYGLKNSFSEDDQNDNYTANRIGIGLSATF